MVSCHRSSRPPSAKAKTHRLHFNPPDSSHYSYNTVCETILSVKKGDSSFGVQRSSRFTVNYFISHDSNDVLIEMTFGGLDYRERSDVGGQMMEITLAPGFDALLNRMRTATIFARLHPDGSIAQTSGAQEIVDSIMGALYGEAEQQQMRDFWGRWADQQLVWKNLDPLTWPYADSTNYSDDHWTDTLENTEDINFRIDKRLWVDRSHGSTATVWSQGSVSADKQGTWLWASPVKGTLTGKEHGKCVVDTATGMLTNFDDSVTAGGDLRIPNRSARLTFLKTIKMTRR